MTSEIFCHGIRIVVSSIFLLHNDKIPFNPIKQSKVFDAHMTCVLRVGCWALAIKKVPLLSINSVVASFYGILISSRIDIKYIYNRCSGITSCCKFRLSGTHCYSILELWFMLNCTPSIFYDCDQFIRDIRTARDH